MAFHGPHALVIDLLATAELRRLQRIRQLGLANFVFPSAEHSRLAHSLGVAHLAIRFGEHLNQSTAQGALSDEDVLDLAVAGLCHDIGHGPMSHAWESAVIGDFDRSAWAGALGLPSDCELHEASWHELVGYALLAWPEGELHRRLEAHELGSADRIRRLLSGTHRVAYLPRLLASDIDIDRCDFLLRDAHQTGVPYGMFDLDWLVSTLEVAQVGSEKIIAFDHQKSLRAVEQFLIGRRAMYETVYHHPTVRGAEATLALFLRRLRWVTCESGWPVSSDFGFAGYEKISQGEPITPSELLRLDDYSLWTLIELIASLQGAQDATLVDLASRVLKRRLLRPLVIPMMTPADATERMLDARDVLRKLGWRDPDFYVYVDHVNFRFTQGAGSSSFLIMSGDDGVSTDIVPLQDADFMPGLLREEVVRLYVPGEALGALETALA